jgi:hypothetical protein
VDEAKVIWCKLRAGGASSADVVVIKDFDSDISDDDVNELI